MAMMTLRHWRATRCARPSKRLRRRWSSGSPRAAWRMGPGAGRPSETVGTASSADRVAHVGRGRMRGRAPEFYCHAKLILVDGADARMRPKPSTPAGFGALAADRGVHGGAGGRGGRSTTSAERGRFTRAGRGSAALVERGQAEACAASRRGTVRKVPAAAFRMPPLARMYGGRPAVDAVRLFWGRHQE